MKHPGAGPCGLDFVMVVAGLVAEMLAFEGADDLPGANVDDIVDQLLHPPDRP